jgi:hypothetical protein
MKKYIAILMVLAVFAGMSFAVQGAVATKKSGGLLSRHQVRESFSIESYTFPVLKGVTDAGAVSDTFNFVEADGIWAAGFAKDITVNIVTSKATSSPTDSGAIDLWIWVRADSVVWYQPRAYAPMGTDTAYLYTDIGTNRAKITHLKTASTFSFNLGDLLGPDFFAKGWRFLASASAIATAFGANDSTKVSLTITKLKRE